MTEPCPTLLTRSELAAQLKTCRRTIQRWQQRGLLPAVVVNKRTIRYDPRDVAEFIRLHSSRELATEQPLGT